MAGRKRNPRVVLRQALRIEFAGTNMDIPPRKVGEIGPKVTGVEGFLLL